MFGTLLAPIEIRMKKLALLTFLLLAVGIAHPSEEGIRGDDLLGGDYVSDPVLDSIFAGSEERLFTTTDSKIILWDEARNYSRSMKRLSIEIRPENP